jgi:hypothetical protein
MKVRVIVLVALAALLGLSSGVAFGVAILRLSVESPP